MIYIKGDIGTGKSFGAEILASLLEIPLLTPEIISSQLKDFNANLSLLEYWINNDFFGRPQNIVIDELKNNRQTKYYGENFNLMTEVIDMRYRAYIRNGSRTILTTNLVHCKAKIYGKIAECN